MLIVEDDAAELKPGQMRKTEFLDELQSVICAEADAELAAVGRNTEGCPYIEKWMRYYRTRSGEHAERALRRYVPEAAGVTNARDYIPLVAARVRQAVTVWATTGKVTGVPEGAAASPPGSEGPEGGAAAPSTATGEKAETPTSGGAVQFKTRAGSEPADTDPHKIQNQLGPGSPLDGGLRSRMESAFGHDFSAVRIHNDSGAAGLSSNLNARAFTIGTNIAFGAGEYHPGSLAGDALIAHELAHVVQQGGTGSRAKAAPAKGGAYDTLEEDADLAAANAVVGLQKWAKGRLADISQNAVPRLRSGLRLQRCKCDRATETKPTAPLTLTLPALPCDPKPETLDVIRAIPGVPATVLGVTNTLFADTFSMDFTSSFNQTCTAKLKKEPEMTFTDFAYTKADTYSFGTETPTSGKCKGKKVDKKLVITPDMAEKFKQGEIEHCNDDKRAFALGAGKFTQAIKELETPYCAEGAKSCADEAKSRLTARTGIKFDDWTTVTACLAGRSKKRDTSGWHDLTDFGPPSFAKDCSTVSYTPDHKKNFKNIGTVTSEDHVKGCGEK